MRLATLRTKNGTTAARLHEDRAVELPYPHVAALLASGDGWRDAGTADGPDHDLRTVDLAPPVPRPEKIFCVGLNYETHIVEMGRDKPTSPTLFAKFACALIGPNDPILIPPVAEQMDWEAELAIVIGRPGRYINEAKARDHIAGFTVLNDITMRDWQHRTKQFLQGKTFERSTPVGPAVVTLDELANPDDLAIRCAVDGVVMQDSRTSDLLFGPEELVSYVSQICTLHPGDIIASGTPGGVGAGRDPQVFLKPGQTVTTTVEGLGELVNTCAAAPRGDGP